MAKKRKTTKTNPPVFASNMHIGICGMAVILTDGAGKAWHISFEDGRAKPVTFGKAKTG